MTHLVGEQFQEEEEGKEDKEKCVTHWPLRRTQSHECQLIPIPVADRLQSPLVVVQGLIWSLVSGSGGSSVKMFLAIYALVYFAIYGWSIFLAVDVIEVVQVPQFSSSSSSYSSC